MLEIYLSLCNVKVNHCMLASVFQCLYRGVIEALAWLEIVACVREGMLVIMLSLFHGYNIT